MWVTSIALLPVEVPPVFVLSWGSFGNGAGQFIAPHGVAISASGDAVYVGDEEFPRIQKFDPEGGFLLEWGDNGTAESGFNGGVGHVAIDAVDNIYVVDRQNRVQKFDSGGNFLRMWGWGVATGANAFEICTGGCQPGIEGTGDGQFAFPHALTVDMSGAVYVTDTGNDRIQKFDSDGNFLRMWGWGVATGANTLESCTSGCQAGIDGSGDGQFSRLQGIAADPLAATIYATDRDNHRVQKFDSDGNFLLKWGAEGTGEGEFLFVDGVAVDEAGDVYVGAWEERIQKFDAEGVFVLQWGSAGTAAGQFDRPQTLAIDRVGNVYVADEDNARVQKFAGPFLRFLIADRQPSRS